MQKAQFAILGAGAIGSIIGAHLAQAGHSVVMLARGHRAETIRRDGLRIKGLVEFVVPVPTLDDPRAFQGAEVLIVATKTHGTLDALRSLSHAPIDVAFSIQNGLWKNDALAEVFGRSRVLGALANTSGELLANGDVLFTRNVNIFIGELSGGESERGQRIASLIEGSGVRSTCVTNILSREWTKFVSWVGYMSMSVVTRAATWQFLSDPDCARLLVRLVRELKQLADAAGIELENQRSLLPLPTILNASEDEAVAAIVQSGIEFKKSAPEHRMSTLQDLDARRPLEIEETLGDALKRAQSYGLSLPLLDTCYRLVAAIDRTNRASGRS